MTQDEGNVAERGENAGGQPTDGGAPPKEGSGQGGADYAPDADSPPPSATTELADEDQGGVTVPSP